MTTDEARVILSSHPGAPREDTDLLYLLVHVALISSIA